MNMMTKGLRIILMAHFTGCFSQDILQYHSGIIISHVLCIQAIIQLA